MLLQFVEIDLCSRFVVVLVLNAAYYFYFIILFVFHHYSCTFSSNEVYSTKIRAEVRLELETNEAKCTY